jgi:hypothetical protein
LVRLSNVRELVLQILDPPIPPTDTRLIRSAPVGVSRDLYPLRPNDCEAQNHQDNGRD